MALGHSFLVTNPGVSLESAQTTSSDGMLLRNHTMRDLMLFQDWPTVFSTLLHCFKGNSYLFLGSSSAFPRWRLSCRCLLWTKGTQGQTFCSEEASAICIFFYLREWQCPKLPVDGSHTLTMTGGEGALGSLAIIWMAYRNCIRGTPVRRPPGLRLRDSWWNRAKTQKPSLQSRRCC